jgi:polar amino acid transport system permease protein
MTYFVNYLDKRLREGPRPGKTPAPADPALPATPLQTAGGEAR